MANLTKVLKSSFRMLLEQPKIFVPRLASSLVGASAVAGILFSQSLTAALTVAAVTLPVLMVLGTFTPVMTAAMVKLKDSDQLLRDGFRETLKNWKGLTALLALGLGIIAATTVVYMLGAAGFYLTGNIYIIAAALILNLAIIAVSGFYLYFAPIAVLDSQKTTESIRSAFSASNRNRREVVLLMAFSIAVLIASSLTTGYLRRLGVALFFLGRIASSVVGTYLLVISPNYYLTEAEK
jgi:hypothetical protein